MQVLALRDAWAMQAPAQGCKASADIPEYVVSPSLMVCVVAHSLGVCYMPEDIPSVMVIQCALVHLQMLCSPTTPAMQCSLAVLTL